MAIEVRDTGRAAVCAYFRVREAGNGLTIQKETKRAWPHRHVWALKGWSRNTCKLEAVPKVLSRILSGGARQDTPQPSRSRARPPGKRVPRKANPKYKCRSRQPWIDKEVKQLGSPRQRGPHRRDQLVNWSDLRVDCEQGTAGGHFVKADQPLNHTIVTRLRREVGAKANLKVLGCSDERQAVRDRSARTHSHVIPGPHGQPNSAPISHTQPMQRHTLQAGQSETSPAGRCLCASIAAFESNGLAP